jgi:hypothetical protein
MKKFLPAIGLSCIVALMAVPGLPRRIKRIRKIRGLERRARSSPEHLLGDKTGRTCGITL